MPGNVIVMRRNYGAENKRALAVRGAAPNPRVAGV